MGTAVPMNRRTVFFVSDQTGVTAETMGHSLLTQFEGQEFRQVTLPFIASVDKAEEAVRKIDLAARETGLKPIIFGTLVQDDIREVVKRSNALFLDFFDAFVGPMEREVGARSSHSAGRAHGMADAAAYAMRIDATNYALANDDGSNRDYGRADVVLVGVSRTSKTPTSIYLANRGIRTANVPLVPGIPVPAQLETLTRPLVVSLHATPERLIQIRQNRLLSMGAESGSGSDTYTDRQSVTEEVAFARKLSAKHDWPLLDVTRRSIEETAAAIMKLYSDRQRNRPSE